jgi:hypothetical protein
MFPRRPVPRTRAPGLTRGRLAWLQATRRRGWAAAMWLCLAGAIAFPAFLLLVDAAAVESGLTQTLTNSGGFSIRQNVASVDAFNALGRLADSRVAARTGGALVPLGGTAAVGPLHLLTVGGAPAQAAAARPALTAVYAAHLTTHVAVVAGVLPADGLGGGETAVTMPQSATDRLGLRLSDRVCLDLADVQPRWCARVVGLWQPLDASDPYWVGAPPGPELTMGRSDLFALAHMRPAAGPVAVVRYWANPGGIAPAGASGLAHQVDALAGDLRAPQRQVDVGLGGALRTFDERRASGSAAIVALATAVAAIGLGTVALVAGRFLDGQSRELALLRARGWPRGSAWRVAFLGPAALGLSAAPAGLALCLLAGGLLSVSGLGLSVQTLRRDDLTEIVTAIVAVTLANAALLAALAARTTWRDPGPSPRPASAAGLSREGRTALLGAGGLAGLVAVALPQVPGVGAVGSAVGAGDVLLAVPGLGAVAVALAAAWLWPLAWWVPGRGSVHGALAGLQLARRPGQHAGAAFALTLATAGAVFAALGLSGDTAPGQPALRLGVEAGLVAGAAGGMLLALAGFGLHFRFTTRRRLLEYGGLLAHGLPPAQLVRSLAAEQAAIGLSSLLTGAILGAVMGLAVLPMPPPMGALAGLATVVALLPAALLVGSLARRLPARAEALRPEPQG